MGASVYKVLQTYTAAEIMAFQGTGDPISLGLGISMVISSFIVGAVVAPDISRYAKTPRTQLSRNTGFCNSGTIGNTGRFSNGTGYGHVGPCRHYVKIGMGLNSITGTSPGP